MDDEVTHQSHEGDFGGLATGDEMFIAGFECGVVPAGDQRGHVESFACQGSAATDKAFALPAAAVPGVWGDARQRGGLRPVEFSQLRHFGQEADDGFGADADDLLEGLGLGLQRRGLLEQGINLLLEFLQMTAELAHQEGILFAHQRQRQMTALLPSVLEQRLQLSAMARQLPQSGGAGIQRGLRLRGSSPAKLREQSRIDAVGLGPQGAGLGEVPNPSGFHDGHGNPGRMASRHNGLFVAAGGFTNDEHRRGTGLELRQEPAVPRPGVGQGIVLILEVYLERVFSYIQSDI